jgi:hypothetical protein
MKRAGYISVLAIANLLLANVTAPIVAAGQGKNSHKQSGKPSTEGRSKETANQNAQWSADPKRGWVRSDESHSTRGRNHLSTAPKEAEGKNKRTGKARKHF